MNANTRNFLRKFDAPKTPVGTPKSLLDAAKGKIDFHRDLSKPTARNRSWKPSV